MGDIQWCNITSLQVCPGTNTNYQAMKRRPMPGSICFLESPRVAVSYNVWPSWALVGNIYSLGLSVGVRNLFMYACMDIAKRRIITSDSVVGIGIRSISRTRWRRPLQILAYRSKSRAGCRMALGQVSVYLLKWFVGRTCRSTRSKTSPGKIPCACGGGVHVYIRTFEKRERRGYM